MLTVRNSVALLICVHSCGHVTGCRSSAPCLPLLSSLPLFLSLSLLSDTRSPTGTQGSRISQRQLASKVLRNYVHFCHLSSTGITSTHYHIWLFTWILGIELGSNKLVKLYVFFGKVYSDPLSTFLLG